MAQKLQALRALTVIPSDDANVPFPATVTTGFNTSVTANSLVDSAATFITDGVTTGDIVYNTTSGLAATVVNVSSETTLTLNADIFLAFPEDFVIYTGNSNTGSHTPCVFFVGGAGNVNVVTEGGDTVLLKGLANGQFIPVSVTRILKTETDATYIVALW